VTRQCYRGRPRASRSPRVSRDAGYIRSICYKLQAEAIRGCNLDQIARLRWQRAEVPSVAAFHTQACCCLRDARIPYAWHKENAACMLAGSPKSAGRGRVTCELSWTRGLPSECARLDGNFCARGRLVPLREPRQVEAAWNRLVRGVKLAPIRSQGLRGGTRRVGATCTAAQTYMHSQRIVARKYDRNGAESGGAVAFPSEWRPLFRSDRLLGLPAADRQSLGCSPAIEGLSVQNPPK
jgi:hypothetical protein